VARDDPQGHRGQDRGHTRGAVDPSVPDPEASAVRKTDAPAYTTRPLGPDTWDDFAALVGANNGVWGGCWCMGFHPEGLDRQDASANRGAKRAHVERETAHQVTRGFETASSGV
jgi:hypothetical protein